MRDIDRGPDPERREVVERHEVTERRTGSEAEPVRTTRREPVREPAAGSGVTWIALVLLLFVVIGLVWFIFARGEPQRPLDNVRIDAPNVEAPTIREERRIEIQTPAPAEPAPPAQPDPQ